MSSISILPLFPLPNVVLFPQVLLPLHIFEPRYRQMVRDVAEGSDPLIGMVLVRSGGQESNMYSVGCAGRMVRKVDLPDGRSNILLQGVRPFLVREPFFDRAYRTAAVEWLPSAASGFRLDGRLRESVASAVRRFVGKEHESELRLLDDPTICDEMFVNLFAFALDLPVEEKQGLLETLDVSERAERLVDSLEFHLLEREYSPSTEAQKIRVQ